MHHNWRYTNKANTQKKSLKKYFYLFVNNISCVRGIVCQVGKKFDLDGLVNICVLSVLFLFYAENCVWARACVCYWKYGIFSCCPTNHLASHMPAFVYTRNSFWPKNVITLQTNQTTPNWHKKIAEKNDDISTTFLWLSSELCIVLLVGTFQS